MGASQLGAQLSDDEVNKITAFLRSLTGEIPTANYPILPPSVGSTRRPPAMNCHSSRKLLARIGSYLRTLMDGEPLRVCRRLVGLSHAAKAISCNWA